MRMSKKSSGQSEKPARRKLPWLYFLSWPCAVTLPLICWNTDISLKSVIIHSRQIASECHGIAAIVGGPSVNGNPLGKNLFNSAYFMVQGAIRQIINKTLLPTYDIFDEYRYFEQNSEFRPDPV